jgi:hypothetical protein
MMDEIENAYLEISRLCHQGKWRMSIPVNEKRDSDCIIISGLAAAEQRGYERALDAAMLTIGHNRDPQETITIYEVVMKLGKLKSDDLKQEGKNGNLTDWRCLHARIAELEQHLNGVMSVLSEIVSEAKTQDPFSDAEGQALLWGARKLLGENVE